MNENEAITVTLTLENDEELECAVLSIFEAEEREYIALLPLDENGDNDDGQVFLYRFIDRKQKKEKYSCTVTARQRTELQIWKTSKTIRNLNVFQMHLMS